MLKVDRLGEKDDWIIRERGNHVLPQALMCMPEISEIPATMHQDDTSCSDRAPEAGLIIRRNIAPVSYLRRGNAVLSQAVNLTQPDCGITDVLMSREVQKSDWSVARYRTADNGYCTFVKIIDQTGISSHSTR